MNIAKIMIPRACTVFLNEKQTVRQGWEVMTRNGYTAIPVLDAEQHYIGTVSAALNQNFVPIVDSRNTLCGILTRRGVIAHLAEKQGIEPKE